MERSLSLIADRLDRAADRLANAGFGSQESRLRAQAERIRNGAVPLEEAERIERELVLQPATAVLSRLSFLAAPGEYDGPSEPGTHTEIVDGMAIQVPDGSHIEIQNGQITIVPDQAPPTPQPPTPQPPERPPHPTPVPPVPTPPAPPPGPIDPATGQLVSDTSAQVANAFKALGVKYPSTPGLSNVLSAPPASQNLPIGTGSISDCSNFVKFVLNRSGLGSIPYTPTAAMPSSPHFVLVPDGQQQAGDIIVQSGHMGIYTGKTDDSGNPIGIQMGNHQVGPAPWGPGGWFKGGGTLEFFRPKP